jgi:fibronectin-binding autotransporter adhesin
MRLLIQDAYFLNRPARIGHAIRRRRWAALMPACALAGMLLPERAGAIVYRNDLTESTFTGLAAQNQFSGVGTVADAAGNEYGTGTVIAPDWVLTATHVVTSGGTASFGLPGLSSASGTVYSYGGGDISLIHLTAGAASSYTSATAIAPLPSSVGASFLDGKFIWNIGYGEQGPYGGTATGYGTVLAGTNTVNSHDGTFVYFTNENTAATSTVYESSTGPGDSGGPMMVQSGNDWYVAAEVYGTSGSSFVDTPVFTTGAYNFLLSTIQTVSGNSSFSFSPQTAPTALTWDANPATDAAQDGSGTWDIQRPNFYDNNTTFNFQFDNSRANDVVFGTSNGAAGTVTITTTDLTSGTGSITANGVTAHSLTFNAAGSGTYTIAAGTGVVLTLENNGSTDPSITTNVNAAISAPITVSGSGTTFTKAGVGVLDLSGSNTFVGHTLVTAGTLQGKTTAALSNFSAAGSISVSSGATLAVNVGGSGEWTSGNVDTLRTAPAYAAGANVGLDTTDGNFSYANSFSGAIGLVKLGANTLTLTGSQTYTGATQVAAGTLALSGVGNNRLPASSTVTFDGTAALNLGSTSQSIGSLTIAGAFTGSISNGTLTYAGTGVLGGNSATFDCSGLTGFTFNQANGTLNINGNPTTFLLAQGSGGNAITGSALNVGTGGTNTTTNLALGTSNTIDVDNIQIGNYHANGSIAFASGLSGATLTLRGQSGGTARAGSVLVGVDSAGAQSQYGVLDTSGGSVDARIGTLTIGSYGANSGLATATGSLTMGSGTIDSSNAILAQSTAENGGTGGTVLATVNQEAGDFRAGTLTLGKIGNTSQAATVLSAIYNLGTTTSTGTLQCTSIIAGALTTTSSNTTATRTINFINGTIQNFNDGAGTVTGLNITGANSTANGVVNINLSSTGTHTFFADAGQTITLQPTAILGGSGGTLAKSGSGTLQVLGTATYTGATTLSAGTMTVDGALGATAVTVGASGALAGSGSVAGSVSCSGALSPGDGSGSAAKLSLSGGLTLSANAVLDFDLGDAGGSDLISTSALTINPSLMCVVARGAAFSAGTYSLIDYTCVLTNNSSGFQSWTLSGLPGSAQYHFAAGTDSADGDPAINLVVTSVPEPIGSTSAVFAAAVMFLGRRRFRRSRAICA